MSTSKNHRLVHGLGHEVRNRLCSLQAGLALLETAGTLRQDVLAQLSQQVSEAVVWSQDFLPLLAMEILQQAPAGGCSSLPEALQAAVARTQPGRACRGQHLQLEPNLCAGMEVALHNGLLVQALSSVLVASSLRGGRGAQLQLTLQAGDTVTLRFAVPGMDRDLSSRDRAGSVEIQTVSGVLARIGGRLEDKDGALHLHLPKPTPPVVKRSQSGDVGTEGEAEALAAVSSAAAHP